MRRACRFVVLAFAVAALAAPTDDIDPGRYLGHIKYLASPELKGRGTGTPGLEKAADYVAKQFHEIGLEPAGGAGYFQRFPVTTNARLGHGNRLEETESGHRKTLKLDQDFRPFNFSESGTLSGGVVFAGYGITAPEYHYDDYEGIDVKDKIVLVLRHEPQEMDEHSPFAGKLLTEHAQFWSKAVNAKRHGAHAVILVNDRANHVGEPDELEKFGRAAGPVNAGIEFLQVKVVDADRWLAAAGKTSEQLQQAIDHQLKPQSFALPGSVQLHGVVDLKREVKTVRNVAGYLPGETTEYVIIGAHYDHLGLGEQFSMAPSMVGTPHPGADDNASGAAGVIELARWFAARPKPKRGILFLAFASEELGLLGSRYYVDHPDLPLANAVAMINLDMIGRLRNNKVYVGGAGTGSNFKEILKEPFAKYDLKVDYSNGGESGSSDHTSFTTQRVPALFFFSGLHSDYHKPSDTWDKIDAPGATRLLRAVADVATTLASEPDRPEFVNVPAPSPGVVAGAGGSGYGAWFGSIPDFGDTPKGVKFAGITSGSPAEKAGLKTGDVLVEFDGKPIGNLYDFTYALRAKKPGDAVAVKVLRGGETVEAKVILGQRR
jgi:hypothetical protein